MCEGRGVTRPHPTEIPYLLAFFPSLRAASDRTLSVYFPIRPQTYDGRFYDSEFKRIVDKHWHKLSDEDRDVVDRELPRIKAQLAVVRPVQAPFIRRSKAGRRSLAPENPWSTNSWVTSHPRCAACARRGTSWSSGSWSRVLTRA